MADRRHRTVFELDAENRKLKQKMRDTEGVFNRVKGRFDILKTSIITFFSVVGIRIVTQFIDKIVNLYDQTINLRRSFRILAEKEGLSAFELMKKLRIATEGTVKDIQLMQAVTQAKFLGLDLKNLPLLFEFATKRAKDTGQSIDYLVDSIVTGIGRKSPLILDNLGIQIKQLDKRIIDIAKNQGKWTGKITESLRDLYLQEAAVGLANDAIKESGETFKTASDKIESYNVQIERLLTLLGALFSPAVKAVFQGLNEALEKLGLNVDELTATPEELIESLTRERLEENKKRLEEVNYEIFKLNNQIARQIAMNKEAPSGLYKKLEAYKAEQKTLKEAIENSEWYLEDLRKIREERAKDTESTKKHKTQIEFLNREFETSIETIRELKDQFGEIDTSKLTTDLDRINDIIEETKQKYGDLAQALGQAMVSGFDTEGLRGALKNVLITLIDFLERQVLLAKAGGAARIVIGDFSAFAQIVAMTALFETAKASVASFAKGVEDFKGGFGYVHQDELIQMPAGTNVYTKTETKRMITSEGSETNRLLRELISTVKNQKLLFNVKGSQLNAVLESDKRNRL